MGLGVGAAGRTGGVLWLAVTPCFLGLPPPLAEAQTTTSGAEDAGVLLGAKAAADTSACTSPSSWGVPENACPLDTWAADTEPCGDGWNDPYYSGWVGVECDARGGRVVKVYLPSTGVGGELLPFFGRLGALLALNLRSPALRGDVADLAGATELRYLRLENCPLVVGEAAALAALVHLGEQYTHPMFGAQTGRLYLAGSGVHGPVAALRALPGLGADWGSWSGHCSKCSAFGGCGAAGLAPVAVRPSPSFRAAFCLSS